MALAEPLPEPTGTLAEPETGGTLTIDLAAIAANWRALAHQALTVECAAVVKANAYGLGLEPVTATLAKAGCKTFFVADLAEARRVRARARDATIYVLNGCTPEGSPAFVELNARPVINSMTELAEWDAFVTARNWQGGAALQVDTGMNRLGISPEEAAALAPRTQTENHGITLLMSHLACAEIADHPLTVSQIKLFRDLRGLYRGIPASLANSSGIFLGDSALCDLARPGAALYGVNPTPGRPNPMQGVVELDRAHPANPQASRRAKPSAMARPGPPNAPRASPSSRWAMPTGCCAPRAPATARRAARRSSPASPARSPAASQWTWSASTSPICPMARSTAATSRPSSAPQSRSTISPRPPGQSAMRSLRDSACVAILSIAGLIQIRDF